MFIILLTFCSTNVKLNGILEMNCMSFYLNVTKILDKLLVTWRKIVKNELAEYHHVL